MPETLHESAPAKVNLALSVGPPGPGGMHPICSWMVTVDLIDDLTIERLSAEEPSRFDIRWHADAMHRRDIDWTIREDLAVRAHRAIEQRIGMRLPVHMTLLKRIPTGGGLGGGSSDAAAMLRAVNTLFELGLPLEDLAEIGATLGSDVPFLVYGGSAIVEGLGGRIERRRRIPHLHCVLVLPDVSCPTGLVYRLYDEHGPNELHAERVRQLVDDAERGRLHGASLFNDLTSAAKTTAPALNQLVESCAALAHRPAHITGSGSTIFLIADDEQQASDLAAAIESGHRVPARAVRFQPSNFAL